jgi:hypothetical protein
MEKEIVCFMSLLTEAWTIFTNSNIHGLLRNWEKKVFNCKFVGSMWMNLYSLSEFNNDA